MKFKNKERRTQPRRCSIRFVSFRFACDRMESSYAWWKLRSRIEIGVVEEEMIDGTLEHARILQHLRSIAKVAGVEDAAEVALEEEHHRAGTVVGVERRHVHVHGAELVHGDGVRDAHLQRH